jgi:choline dehydrogenase-like flavoprotein
MATNAFRDRPDSDARLYEEDFVRWTEEQSLALRKTARAPKIIDEASGEGVADHRYADRTHDGSWRCDPKLREDHLSHRDDLADVGGVGGAALHYFANFPRLLPNDFKIKSERGRAQDWSISY